MFNNQSIYHIELHILDKMEMNELLAHGMCQDRTGPQHSFQAASETTGVLEFIGCGRTQYKDKRRQREKKKQLLQGNESRMERIAHSNNPWKH